MVSRRTVYAKVTGSNPVVLVPLMQIRPLNKNLARPFGICGFGLAFFDTQQVGRINDMGRKLPGIGLLAP